MHDLKLHLFVDSSELQQSINVEQSVNTPKYMTEPVVMSDTPWEAGCRAWAWGSVIQEKNGLLRMWYFSFNAARNPETKSNGGYCYAESMDGIHWQKPTLGLYDWNGSKDNNIFLLMGRGEAMEIAARGEGFPAFDENGKQIGIVNNMDGLTVVKDENEDNPEKRYKLIANMQDHRMWAKYYRASYPNTTDDEIDQANRTWGQYLLASPDGIHWRNRPMRIKSRCNGDYMMVTRDDRNNQWWLNERPPSLSGRNAGLTISKSLEQWPDPTETVFSNREESGFGKKWEWHGGLTPFNYGNQDLGFLERWSNASMSDMCELISHRDREPWRRVAPGTMFLNTGPEGSFFRSLIYPLHNGPIRIGNQLFIYFSGGHYNQATGQGMNGGIGAAIIGLDRFVALANRRQDPGMILTKCLDVTGNQLQVNVEPIGGAVRVALRDPYNKDIPDYSLDDCTPISQNVFREPVRWHDNPDLSSFIGKKVRLCFEVKGAALYSFKWAD